MMTKLIMIVNEMNGLGMEPNQLHKIKNLNYYIHFRLSAGGLALRWNQIVPSLLKTAEKLHKLGFTYTNGKVAISTISNETDI